MNTKNTKQADTWEEADLLARAKNPNTWEIRFENEFCYNDVVTFTPIKKWKKTLYTNIDQTGAIKDFIRQVEADAIDRTEKRFTEEWGSVVEKNVLASKIMDREIKAAYARGREEERKDIEKLVENMHKEVRNNIDQRENFMPIGDYSKDYASGTLRGITLVGRALNTPTQPDKEASHD